MRREEEGAGHRHLRVQSLVLEELRALLRDDASDPALADVRVVAGPEVSHAELELANGAVELSQREVRRAQIGMREPRAASCTHVTHGLQGILRPIAHAEGMDGDEPAEERGARSGPSLDSSLNAGGLFLEAQLRSAPYPDVRGEPFVGNRGSRRSGYWGVIVI
jgi:hypothetical protein